MERESIWFKQINEKRSVLRVVIFSSRRRIWIMFIEFGPACNSLQVEKSYLIGMIIGENYE